MFRKQKLASRPQDAANPPNGVLRSGNRAQRERGQQRQWNSDRYGGAV